jgi:D-apionolactonase
MTVKQPSRAVRLFGTEEPVEPPRILKAGALSAEFETGNLRYIRYGGIEMIRAISFIVRDRNWATYTPALSNLLIEEDGDGFAITYDAETKDKDQALRYSAKITGSADGRIEFAAQGAAVTDFITNRTGFVVLHPIAGVAGEEATVETADGKTIDTKFPDLISPSQPIMNMRAITHEFAPGAKVVCRMEGDVYEMEDQRNWMDASYKTYVRPLAKPWPYTLKAGDKLTQKVSLRIEGKAPSGTGKAKPITLRVGKNLGSVPPLGVGLAPEDAASAGKAATRLAKLKPAYVICHYDTRLGHDRKSLAAMLKVATALKAVPWLEAVVTRVEGFEEEIAELSKLVKRLKSPFKAVFLSPASDMKSTQPTGPWPPCPPLADIYKLARLLFPGARIGGGMMSYFTEINRKRPPAEHADFITFTNSSLVHASDDRSVMEGLESLPAMAKSVRAFIGTKPFVVGPSAIGMRFNPYGAAPQANPKDVRQAMNRNDPRQRGLMGAAWALAYFAHFARNGAAAIALGGLTGPFGALHSKSPWPQAWFDKHKGLYPVFHILRGLSRLKGAALLDIEISRPRDVQALAARRKDGKVELWIANLTGEPVIVDVGRKFAGGRTAVLDAERFIQAAERPEFLDRVNSRLAAAKIELAPYATCRLISA